MSVKPHVSPALVQVRRGVTLSAAVAVLCATVQLLIFGFLHFTDVRWDAPPARGAEEQPLRIVLTPPSEAAPAPKVGVPVRTVRQVDEPPERTLGRWDHTMSQFSTMASSVGLVSVVVLSLQLMLGSLLAGGAVVPGCAEAVSASGWGWLAAVACVPLSEFIPSFPISGVFGSYQRMALASQTVDAGGGSEISLIALYALMPAACIAVLGFVVMKFHRGVEAGCIITSVSQLDDRIDKEIADIAARGVQNVTLGRPVGALNRAFGDVPPTPGATPAREPAPEPTEKDADGRGGRRPI